LLVVGAHAVLYHRKPHDDALRSFAKKLMQTKPFKLVAVCAVKRANVIGARDQRTRGPTGVKTRINRPKT
jgi:hypothetical protein